MKNLKVMKTIALLILIVVSFSCKKDTTPDPTPNPQLETGTVTDFDGNTYQTVKIGNQWWMAENFKATKTSSGQNIQEVFVYNDTQSNATVYGQLYTWAAAVQATPTGWHLPTKEEWEAMINLLGGSGIAGGKMKETGTAHWNAPNTGASNSSGLSTVAGGFRGGDGVYYTMGEHGSYWGTANNTQDPYCVYLYNNAANVVTEVSPIDKTSGIAFAVRYIKNE